MTDALTTDERVADIRTRFAREMQALCNEGEYGTGMAMALCIQLLRIIFVETKQPPEVIEKVVQTLSTPGTSAEYLEQRLS